MKKIIFIIHLGNIKKSSGILEKVINQSKNMRDLGIHYRTYILFSKDDKQDIVLFDKYDYIKFIPLDFYTTKVGIIKRIINEERIYIEYIKICEQEKGKYDYIYVRMNPYYHNFIKFIKKFSGKIICEHNSIEEKEYKANKKRVNFKLIKYCFHDRLVRKNIVFFVAVTKEIYDYQMKKYRNKKGVLITNGIDVKKYPLKKAIKYDGKNLNLIFVGNIRYWHGLERILEAIENYNGSVNIKLHICGLTNQIDYIDNIIEHMTKRESIIRHGYMSHLELDKLFDEMHLAIGSLAIYKFLLNNASTLKNREYFSRGIPVVYSAVDDDISVSENEGLYLEVANDDSKIDMKDIIKFVEKFYKESVNNTKKIRKFAEDNLDYSKKMKKLKQLIIDIDNDNEV